ncbi:MAG: type I-U CRISPR-associated RAMP protein Csb1/Cas7u [Planctomycetaceae bacterium]
MPIDFKTLDGQPRVLIEAALKPVAGTRIQPTGFPDLGPATYDAPDGNGGTIATLLVESAQSMANRLEAVCWDDAADDLSPELRGLPYVRVKLAGLGNGTDTTTSLLEFHRLNSPYIMNGVTQDGKTFADTLKPELGMTAVPAASKKKKPKAKGEDTAMAEAGNGQKEPDDVAGVVNLRKLAKVCFEYDPNSLVHGVFLEKIAGRLRHPRALSAFIEASGVGRADSGGVKFDRALPKPSVAGVDAKGGYGNVPFHRSEFTAKSITAYFSLDLAQICGYGLGVDASRLLIALSLWKVRKFLDSNMRLRTACELELADGDGSIHVKRPKNFDLPPAAESATTIGELIKKCKSQLAEPTVTELIWNKP